MTSLKNLLELRKKIKSKKPDFVRQDIHKKAKLKKKWRKPKGLHSKIRQCRKGKRKSVSTGYGSPKIVRGLTKDGLRPVIITSKNLEKVNKGEEGIIISSKLGNKKRIEILKKAKENGIKVINIKNIDDYIKNIDEKLRLKKEQKKGKEKEEKGKKERKKESKADLVTKVSEEEKKELEKKEKDKLLTKRDIK